MAEVNLDSKSKRIARKKLGLGSDVNPLESEGEWRDHRAHIHIPFAVYRANDADNGNNWLFFWVNPAESQWTIATRTTIEKVSGGAIHHEWPAVPLGAQQGGTRFDQPVIRFAFQTGVITPHAYQDITRENHQHMPPGLGNFYDFLEVLDQPNVTANGDTNYVYIHYFSSTFPKLVLQGFFTPEGVSWTDSADNPYAIQSWGASFEVFGSTPSLNSSSELRSHFMSFGFSD
jgi:hypothetical protein